MLDHAFYREMYPDVAELSDHELNEHWRTVGAAQGRIGTREDLRAHLGEAASLLPETFDWRSYLAFNRDLAKNGWNGVEAAEHYVRAGHKAKLPADLTAFLDRKGLSLDDLPEDFEWQAYLALNPDVVEAGYSTRDGAIAHYLQYGIGRHWRRYQFDAGFYADYYLWDAPSADGRREIEHWLDVGRALGWHPTAAAWLKSLGVKADLSMVVPDFGAVARLNGLASFGYRELEEVIAGRDLSDLRIYESAEQDGRFWMLLADHAAIHGDDELAEFRVEQALRHGETADAYQRLGDVAVRQGRRRVALRNYGRALELGSRSVWPGAHSVTLRSELGEIEGALRDAERLAEEHAGDAVAGDSVRRLGYRIWSAAEREVMDLAARGRRAELIDVVSRAVDDMARVRASWVAQGAIAAVPSSLRRDKVLLVADKGLPQTLRYRVDQKVEQLELQGRQVTVVDWQDADEAHKQLPWHDVLIVYRAPAWPDIVRLVIDAKAAGKVTFYELDDMIFDVEFPPPIGEYAGQVDAREYQSLMTGMAAYRAAARLCDYAIGSTLPLVERLGALVQTRRAFLHRNGLDSRNPRSLPKAVSSQGESVTVFYGSGTKAHNDDFIDLVLPALDRLLSESSHVRLMVVGHLVLPEWFVRRHRAQIAQLPLTRTVEEYMDILRGADINLAVLQPGVLTDGKSELKWFEAGNFGIPSVVSDTANYRDIIRDGEDGLIARTPDDWYRSLRMLVDDRRARQVIGEAARQRILSEYSLKTLGENLVSIIDAACDDMEARGRHALAEAVARGSS
ncbi:glycosyltransferase family protein [Microbacterium paludicola]|uniref:glycosyltransferase family protein n=1 Tax=Microbacterium paludicola TaxID=300019 RepID=UPI00142FBA61|nr:glycosyltransferase [Microbacterium paludicola]MBF0817681.1 glycosyltransferase [Microbacterium paludicola]